jgi:hypothetical protein
MEKVFFSTIYENSHFNVNFKDSDCNGSGNLTDLKNYLKELKQEKSGIIDISNVPISIIGNMWKYSKIEKMEIYLKNGGIII